MANCNTCGAKLPFLGGCEKCAQIAWQKAKEEIENARVAETNLRNEAASIMVTTETCLDSIVRSRKKVIVATIESALDAKIAEKHDELLHALKVQAHLVGANAVVGVTFNVVETYAASIGVGEFKKFKMMAFGTAVEI